MLLCVDKAEMWKCAPKWIHLGKSLDITEMFHNENNIGDCFVF